MMWQRDTSGDCPDEDEGSITLSGGSTISIAGLEEDSNYTVTVTVMNEIGNAIANSITAATREEGILFNLVCITVKLVNMCSAKAGAQMSRG